jgi:ribosomal protein L37AE/L43A
VTEKHGNVVICSFPEKQEKPIDLEVQFEKSRLDINGMTMYEYYKIIPEGTVTRVSSLYKQSFESVIFLDSNGQIIQNLEIRKSFEEAIEKTADYSECPKCANTCRSQSATLAACPNCGQIFEVEKYPLITDDPITRWAKGVKE